MIKAKQHNLSFLYKDRYPLLTVDIYLYTTKEFSDVLGNHHRNFAFVSSQGEVTAYYPLEAPKKSKEIAIQLLDSGFFRKHFNESRDVRFAYYEYQKMGRRVDISDEERFDEYIRVYSGLVAYFRSSRPSLSDPLVDVLKEELSKVVFDEEKKEEILHYLTTPLIDNPISDERKDWYELLQSGECNEDRMSKYIDRHPWLCNGMYFEEEALEFFCEKYENDRRRIGEIGEEIKEFENDRVKALEYRSSFFNEKKMREVNKVFKVIQKQSEERLLIKTSLMSIDYVSRDMLQDIANIAGIGVKEMINSYTIDNIKELLSEGKKLSQEEIEERNSAYVYLVKNLKANLAIGAEAKKMAELFIDKNIEKDIRGTTAHGGYAKGRVRIVNSGDDMKDFKKGDILVSSMTQPSIVSAIGKASAIITDQGGMISHAAIIARELKIPCIVGTKIATQVLKNGDMVEVDANEGVVRLI